MAAGSGCWEAFTRAVREFNELTRALDSAHLTRAEIAALRRLLRDLIALLEALAPPPPDQP